MSCQIQRLIMPVSETFTPSVCPKCGEPKNVVSAEGQEIRVRCTCDWERGFHDRIKHTIMRTFYDNGFKTIMDWSPPIFKQGGTGKFKTFIKIQKALAMQKIYDFCFKIISPGESNRIYSLYKNIQQNHNLYIRGPLNSGRDLLLATIKIFAAAHDISTTPIPYEWATFKQDISQSDWNGKEAELARARVTDYYRNVQLFTLANVQSEGHWNDEKRKKFRSSLLIDDVLTRRQTNPGSMIFTSAEFIGQIGDGLGDRFPEILTAPKTSILIMLSSLEADRLLDTLDRKLNALRQIANKIKESDKKTHQDALAEKALLKQVEECFYLEHVFNRTAIHDDSLTQNVQVENSYLSKVKEKLIEFNTDKEANNLTYQEGVKRAKISIVKECQELSSKMTPREIEEVGEMMCVACSGEDKVKEFSRHAVQLREKMAKE